MRLSRDSLIALFCILPTAAAQTVTVTTAADVIDIDPFHATIADLPGPDGRVSFSEAMIATNNTPGHQTVGFAIPRNEWILQFVLPGRAVLNSGVGFYFRASDPVTIDGRTQTAFTGDTNPDGWEVAFYGVELYLNADDCVLLGIDRSAVSLTGNRCRATGNTGGMNLSVFSGNDCRIENNDCGTIKIDRADRTVVVGNTAQRVRVLGFGPTTPARDNRIGGPAPGDRNFLTGYGTWNSEGLPAGATVQLFATEGTLIENNRIGTTPDGMAQGNQAATMGIEFAGDNVGTVIKDNQIAGILGLGRGPHHNGQLFGWAIYAAGTARDVDIVGNTLGLDATGAPTLGSVFGIDVGYSGRATAQDFRIGGALAGSANHIAGHRLDGVIVGERSQGIRILGNAIHDNGGLGIDLVAPGGVRGPTANDPGDRDAGGNGLQNHPTIRGARSDGAHVEVRGSLQSSATQLFRIDLFGSPACDPSGFGEGASWLGATSVTTDASGDADFLVLLAAALPVGRFVTATATAMPSGDTSEFSVCTAVTPLSCQPDLGAQGPGRVNATLCGDGLAAGQLSHYRAIDAPAHAPGALLLSLDGFADVPAFGGTLRSFAGNLATLTLNADAAGHASLPLDGLPSPTFDLVLQCGFLDPSTSHGLAVSNAVLARFGR